MPIIYTPPGGSAAVSLSDITAGTLNPSLKMVATNTATAGATEIFGSTTGMVINTPSNKFLEFQANAVAQLRLGYNSTNYGLFAAANSGHVVVAGGSTLSATDGGYVSCGGITSVDPVGASVHIGTAIGGSGQVRFTGPSSGVGTEYMGYWDETGMGPVKVTGQYWGKFSPASLTASRTYTLPDASGTLMVSGGVSLSDLSAGVLAVPLTLNNSQTITPTHRAMIGTATGVNLNTPTGTTLNQTIGGVVYSTLGESLSQIGLAGSTTSVPSGYLYIEPGTGVSLNHTAGDATEAASSFNANLGASNIYHTTNQSNSALSAALGVQGGASPVVFIQTANTTRVTVGTAITDTSIPIKWNTNVALTGTDYSIGKHSSTQLGMNVPTGSTIVNYVNAVAQQTFSVNGIQFNTAAGTVTAGTAGLYQTSAGPVVNTPTGTVWAAQINGSEVGKWTSAGLDLSTNSTQVLFGASGTAATTRSITGISTGLSIDTANSTSIQGRINGTRYLGIGINSTGIQGNGLFHLGTTAANGNINGSTSGLSFGYVTGGFVTGQVNSVAVFSIGRNVAGTQSDASWHIGISGGTNITQASNVIDAQISGTVKWSLASSSITIGDAVNYVFNTTTGTKLGTGTTQKIGFWNATPITQPTRAGQLTDNSGGTSGGNTIAAIGGAVDPTAALKADTANAIATLAARLNLLEGKLSAAGGGSGITA